MFCTTSSPSTASGPNVRSTSKLLQSGEVETKVEIAAGQSGVTHTYEYVHVPNREGLKILLLTANMGSLFESTDEIVPCFTEHFLALVAKYTPHFLALHIQELGGKNYKTGGMAGVRPFVSGLAAGLANAGPGGGYSRVAGFFDTDFANTDAFTALGSVYFVHSSCPDVQIRDCKRRVFTPIFGGIHESGFCQELFTDDPLCPLMYREKFRKDIYPHTNWSRKGFMITQWLINGNAFNFVNCHIFHDACNMQSATPVGPHGRSVYACNREVAVRYTHAKCSELTGGTPTFYFGDFNFRLALRPLLEHIGGLSEEMDDSGKLQTITSFTREDCVVSVSPKKFVMNDSFHRHNSFILNAGSNFKQFDREMDNLVEILHEAPLNFAPTYPYVEEVGKGTEFLPKRCPAWCDRVLMNEEGFRLISTTSDAVYDSVAKDASVGDHKPVFLSFNT